MWQEPNWKRTASIGIAHMHIRIAPLPGVRVPLKRYEWPSAAGV